MEHRCIKLTVLQLHYLRTQDGTHLCYLEQLYVPSFVYQDIICQD